MKLKKCCTKPMRPLPAGVMAGVSSDKVLDVKLTTRKELGGGGGTGTNPEQLFAAGHAAFFIGALKFVAMQKKVALASDPSIDSTVGIGQIPGGFGIEVELKIHLPGLSKPDAEALVHAADKVCPDSNATRNDVDVRLLVV